MCLCSVFAIHFCSIACHRQGTRNNCPKRTMSYAIVVPLWLELMLFVRDIHFLKILFDFEVLCTFFCFCNHFSSFIIGGVYTIYLPMQNTIRIAIGRTGASSEHVDQHAMVVPSRDSKIQWLVEMLPILSPLGRCLVFVATRADCDFLAQMIQSSPSFEGGAATATNNTVIVSIHGDKDQRDRNSAIAQFKKQSQAILIATDVASRGLDIPDVVTVINFDAAKNIDSHVHRVGRAGRLSKDGDGNDGVAGGQHQRGVVYTLLTEKDSDFAQSLVEAFEREGRAVSQELVALCQKSKRYGGGRAKHSKDGLGFGGGGGGGASNASNNSRGMASTASAQHSTRGRDQGSGGGSYYGPTSGPPTAKRSRWS